MKNMQKCVIFVGSLLLFILSCVSIHAQTEADIRAYISRYKRIALEQEKQTGIPASITLAQGILESGAGTSWLTHNSNNHFGIKADRSWGGRICLAQDDEIGKSRFRVYNSAEESFINHSRFLMENSRYRSLFSKSVYDYRGWAIGLQRAGYATSPTYAEALIGYIDRYQLYAINGGVKLRAGMPSTVTRTITIEEIVEIEDLQMDETEKSEEEINVEKTLLRVVVDINHVSCTILYPGETLSSIALRYDIPKTKLLEYNETTSEKDLQEGDVVFLQKKKKKYEGAKDFHIVKEGETLYKIAQMYGIRRESLRKMNHKDFLKPLSVGERILLK